MTSTPLRGARFGLATLFAPVALVLLAALALTPAAQANIEQGNPEVYETFKKAVPLPAEPTLAETNADAVEAVGWGDFALESQQVAGSVLECGVLAFGTGWNAKIGSRARGQILGFTGEGHMRVGRPEHEEVSAVCRGASGKAWMTIETPLERIGKKTICTTEGKKLSECPAAEEREVVYKEFKRENEQTTPWNTEPICRATEIEEGVFEYEAVVKIGLPDKNSKHANFSEENKSPCRTQAELEAEEKKLREETEAEQTLQEAEGKHGKALELKSCYAKRGVPGDTPAGCLRINLVAPVEGVEIPLGGTLKSRWINGVSPTDPSHWFQFGNPSEGGMLQCEKEGCAAFATASGRVTAVGSELQLLQLR
jgi:hypothetical protein